MGLNIVQYFRNNFNLLLIQYKKYELRQIPEAHQLTNTTAHNRYPELFKTVRDFYITNPKSKKILSFGCSTGDECMTISEYFPGCKIVGTDINRKNLKVCRKRFKNHDIKFIFSNPDLIGAESPFDIIFCLSVLCRWEDTEFINNCSNIYPFSKFENQLSVLDRCLSPGGLLVIYNGNFRFSDSCLYTKYRVVHSDLVLDSGFVHKFNRNNIKIDNFYQECIFRKLPE